MKMQCISSSFCVKYVQLSPELFVPLAEWYLKLFFIQRGSLLLINPVDFFMHLFSEDLIDDAAHNTNVYAL